MNIYNCQELKFFKFTSWKRVIILGITLVATVLAVVLVPFFYTSRNVHKSREYAGGAEYVVQVKSNNPNTNVNEIAEEIYSRIDSLGIAGVDVQPEKGANASEKYVRVTYPGATSDADIAAIEKEIIEKPRLVFTDVWGNPLFTPNGNFNPGLNASTSGAIKPLDTIDWKVDSQVPLVPGAAQSAVTSSGNKVQISIQNNKQSEWAAATRYISGLANGNNKIVAWLNLGDFINQTKNTPGSTAGKTIWEEANNNPYNAAYVNNNPATGILRNGGKYLMGNVSNYMLSAASVTSVLTGSTFVIEGNFSQRETVELAKKINFGAADYSLTTKFSSKIDAAYGADAFQKAILAGIVVFSIIAVFLVVNYGLLGALSTISIALFVMITLTLFTVMRGEYSPESIAALIIGVGVSVDANIITFERLKAEIYGGSKLKRAAKVANRKSFWTIFDANITTLIIAVVLFYFGTRNIVGLSITLMLSIVFTLIIMLGFTRMTSSLMLGTGWFDKRLHLLGVKPKSDVWIQSKLSKVNYMQSSRYFSLISAAVIIGGAIAFLVTALMAGHFGGGLNLSSDFKAGTVYQFKFAASSVAPGGNVDLTSPSRAAAEAILHKIGFSNADFVYGYTGSHITSIKVVSGNGDLVNVLRDSTSLRALMGINSDITIKSVWGSAFSYSSTSSAVADKLVQDALIAIAIAIGGIIVYSLIRFRWTYAIAAILALIHDGIIVVAMFAMTRVQVSPVFIAGLLSILGYSINDTIVTFDRVREKMREHTGNLTKEEIRKIANTAIGDTIKRSLLTSFVTILAVGILMCFGNATKIEFNFAMLIGMVFGTYSSIVIATFFWTKLEWARQKGIARRTKRGFWAVSTKEEQTIQGINDFNV